MNDADEFDAAIRRMKEQLLIVFLRRLMKAEMGRFVVPVTEVDATGNALLDMTVEGKNFVFDLRKKS